MPLYDYRCKECGNEIEVMHSIDAVGPSTCDVCGGAMKKALSTPAIHFKGSGWAKKDYQAANKAKAKAAKADATSPAKSDATSKSGGDGDGSSKSSTGDTHENAGTTKETAKSPVVTAGATTSKASD